MAPAHAAESEEWLEVRSDGVVVLGDAGEEALLSIERRYRTLDRALETFGVVPAGPTRTPLTIFLFRDQEGFRRGIAPDALLGARTGGLRTDIGGRFVVLDASATSSGDVLFHEMLHDAVERAFGAVPLWFGEGIAELYETFRVEDGYAIVGEPDAATARWLEQHPYRGVRGLLVPNYAAWHRNNYPQSFYAQSWSLVHYLMIGNPARRDDLVRYLSSVAAGVPPLVAFEEAFGSKTEAIVAEWSRYVATGVFPVLRVPVEIPSPRSPEGRIRPLRRGERDAMLARLRIAGPEEGRRQARRALNATIAAHPDEPTALTAAAFLARIEARYDDAVALFDRAIASGAVDPSTLYLAGDTLWLREFDRARPALFRPVSAMPPAVGRARELLLRAIASVPSDPDVLESLGKTWLFDPGDPREGIRYFERADRSGPRRLSRFAPWIGLLVRARDRDGLEALLEARVRPSGDVRLVSLAEDGLDMLDLSRAAAAEQAGDLQAALAIFRDVHDRTSDKARRKQIKRHIAALESQGPG